MSVSSTGSLAFPYRLELGPTSPTLDLAQSPEEQLKRLSIAQAGIDAFQETRRQLTEGTRRGALAAVQAPLYQNLSDRFAALAKQLTTRASVTTTGALNLGAGTGNATGNGTDPTAPLYTQSFGLPITAGTVDVTVKANGTPATTQSATIDPSQSLASNLQNFSNLTFGGTQPLTTSYADGEVQFQVASTSGSSVSLSVADNSSNFFEAVSNGTRTASGTFTGSTAVGSAPGTAYSNLTVGFNGITATLTGLAVSSTGLSPFQRATELAAQLNNGLAQTGLAKAGLTAQALSDGSLQFRAAASPATTTPSVGISLSESGPGQSLGFNTGFTAALAIKGTPQLTGPDATLGALAGALGLQAVNGQFTGTVNGVSLTFKNDETLSQALTSITRSSAGVTASYDPAEHKITLTQNNPSPAPLDVKDTSGNFFTVLRVHQAAGLDLVTGAKGALQNLLSVADSVSDTLGLVESAVSHGVPLSSSPLLADLAATLGAQFKPSKNGEFGTLADFGITRVNGQVQVDAARQSQLLQNDPNQLSAAAATLASQQLVPLLQAGQQAADEETQLTPQAVKLAQQNVHARAELVRLQDHQSNLLYQESALDQAQKSVASQRKGLEAATQRIVGDKVHVPPTLADLAASANDAQRPASERPDVVTQTATPNNPQLTSPAQGLLSFGLLAPPR